MLNFQKNLYREFIKVKVKNKFEYYEFELPDDNEEINLFLKSKKSKIFYMIM